MAQTKIPLNCRLCSKEFFVTQSRIGVRFYCSYVCAMNDKWAVYLPLGERFVRYIEHSAGCWIWTGKESGKQGARYGIVNITPSLKMLAHRFSYIIHNGEIPGDLWVLHRCDTPLCVNPDHLFLGTQQDNIADMIAKGRDYRGSTSGKSQRRLSKAEVKEIRRRYEAGETLKQIATDMQIPYGNLFPVVRGKTHAGDST